MDAERTPEQQLEDVQEFVRITDAEPVVDLEREIIEVLARYFPGWDGEMRSELVAAASRYANRENAAIRARAGNLFEQLTAAKKAAAEEMSPTLANLTNEVDHFRVKWQHEAELRSTYTMAYELAFEALGRGLRGGRD